MLVTFARINVTMLEHLPALELLIYGFHTFVRTARRMYTTICSVTALEIDVLACTSRLHLRNYVGAFTGLGAAH